MSGAPPKSAAPASAPPRAASQATGTKASSAHSPSRPSGVQPQRLASPPAARRPGTAADADEAELEQHLVVGLLRDERPVRAAGSRAAAGRRSAPARPGRSARTPQAAARRTNRCRGRAGRGRRGRRRTRRSVAGSSSLRTDRASPARGRTTPGGSRARRCASESVPAVTATVTASVARTAPPPKAPTREPQTPAGRQPRDTDRGGSRERRRAMIPRPPAAIATAAKGPGQPPRAWIHARPTTRAIVATAARSCSPRNEPWRPAGATDELHGSPEHGHDGVRDDQLCERAEPFAAVEEGGGAQCERAELGELAGRRERGCAVRDRRDNDQECERRGRRQKPGRGQRPAGPEAQAGEHRSDERARRQPGRWRRSFRRLQHRCSGGRVSEEGTAGR